MKKSRLLGAIFALLTSALIATNSNVFAGEYIKMQQRGQNAAGNSHWTIPPITRQWDNPKRSGHWTIPPVNRQWDNPQRSGHWTIPPINRQWTIPD